MRKNGLAVFRRGLPKTIVDALALVSILRERYLWIDTLCLVSDDADDMFRGIQMMDQIYAGSTLNIIAASGDDANAGLPGVLPNSRKVQQHVVWVRCNIRIPVFREDGYYLLELQLRGTQFSLEIRRSVFLINISVEFLLYYHYIYMGPVPHRVETGYHQTIHYYAAHTITTIFL